MRGCTTIIPKFFKFFEGLHFPNMNSIAVHARAPAMQCRFAGRLDILIPSAALLLKNGIRKAGNLLQDFLLGGAADRQRVFSFESSS